MKVQLTWKDNSVNETEQEVIVKFYNNGVGPAPATAKFPVAPDVESTEIDIATATPHLCEVTVVARNTVTSAESSDKFVTATQFPNQFLMSQLASTVGNSLKETIVQNPVPAPQTIPDYDSDFNTNGSFSSQQPDGTIYSFTPNRVRKYDKDFVPTTIAEPLSKNACPNPAAIAPAGTVYTVGQRQRFAEIFVHKNEKFESLLELDDEQTNNILFADKLPVVLLDGNPVWITNSSSSSSRNGIEVYKNHWTFYVIDAAAKTVSTFNYENEGEIVLGGIGLLDTGEVWVRVNTRPSYDSYFLIIDFVTKKVREVKADKTYPYVHDVRTVTLGKKVILTGHTYDENNDSVGVVVLIDLSNKDTYAAEYTTLTKAGEGAQVSNPALLPSGQIAISLQNNSNGKITIASFDAATNTVTLQPTHHDHRGHLLLIRHGNLLRAMTLFGSYYELTIEQPKTIALDSRFTHSNEGCGCPNRFSVGW